MNFDLSPDQQQLQARVRNFAQREIAPLAVPVDVNAPPTLPCNAPINAACLRFPRSCDLDSGRPGAKVEELATYDAIIIGAGTRFGRLPSQMANFLDQAGGLWARAPFRASRALSAACYSPRRPRPRL